MAERFSTGQVAIYSETTEPRLQSLIRRGKLRFAPRPGPDRKRWWTKEQREQAREVVGNNR